MQAQRRKVKQLHYMVKTADMVLLMEDDVFRFLKF